MIGTDEERERERERERGGGYPCCQTDLIMMKILTVNYFTDF